MIVMAVGMQKIRNGYGEKFYVATLRTAPGESRYSLRRFKTATEALVYGRRLEARWRRMFEMEKA